MGSHATEPGEVVEGKAAAASKASFKLDLIETVNADPQMQPSDLALIAAHLCVMAWPEKRAWLSTSKARAMTNLSERQVVTSRARLIDRGYFVQDGIVGTSKIFRLENPRLDDMRHHVAITTEHLKEQQKDRQTERRRLWRAVRANSAGNFPTCTPQKIALKGEQPIKASTGPSNQNLYALVQEGDDVPFEVPETEAEAEILIAAICQGQPPVTIAVLQFWRAQLAAGKLTPNLVRAYFRSAA